MRARSLLGVLVVVALGMFALLLEFIPSLGSIVATLLPLPVVLVSPDIPVTAPVAELLAFRSAGGDAQQAPGGE